MRKKKKKNWWQNQDEYYQGRGVDVYDDDYESYDYSFATTKEKKQETAWEYYQRTGKWRGQTYYQTSLVDYGYIEKMANAFAARFDIKIEAGSEWSSNVKEKKLVYEPMSLMQYPKARIIALLLHEVGHLTHTGIIHENDSYYIKTYRKLAHEVLNVFEDFRIDKIMLNSYEGAGDVYEAMKPVVLEIAKQYEAQSYKLRQIFQYVADQLGRQTNLPEAEKQARIQQLMQVVSNKDNLFDYLAAICCAGYGIPIRTDGRIKAMVDKTMHTPKLAEKCKTTKAVLAMLDKEVYPVIEELFKELFKNMKEVEQMMGQQFARLFAKYVKQFLEETNEIMNNSKGQQHLTRSGAGENQVPKEWADGDYASLRDSVDTPIKELIRKLTFLKKEETVPRFVNEQKRGKLHKKSLYKQRTGNTRLFRQKLESQDTVSSFAFSVVLDKSGSMQENNRMIHSTRASIMFAEVFDKMKIPYELQLFGSNNITIKKFDDKLTDHIKKRLGGVVDCDDGSTDLYKVFNHRIALAEQPQKNKVMIIISDGGIGGGIERIHQDYMNKLKQKGFHFIGVGLNCGDSIVRLCYDNGFTTDTPDKLPQLFSDILKQVIFSKKKV